MQEYVPYDSSSPSPTGTKAFYTYLKEENFPVSKWNQNPAFLPQTEGSSLLIMIEPYFIPDSDVMNAYIEFMEEGNTILLLKNNPRGFFDIQINHIGNLTIESTEINYNGKHYESEIMSNIRIDSKDSDTILLSDNFGDVAIKRNYGAGSLILSVTPTWMMNEHILKNDHLPLLLNLLQENGFNYSRILIDEFYHGGSPSSALDVYQNWFLILLFQGALVTLLTLWMQGKRFGPIREAREEFVRYSDESIRALAAWQLRGKTYNESLHTQADYLKYLLQEKWGIPYNRSWIDSITILTSRWKNKDSSQIVNFIYKLDEILKNERITKQEFLYWSKELDTLRKEVEEG